MTIAINNRNKIVDEFLKKRNHPLLAEINAVRDIILGVDDGISEDIKWSSPTFIYKGNIASFFLNAQKHVCLMFHRGAFIDDPSGLLQGDGPEGRVVRLENMKDIISKKNDLVNLIKTWIKMHED